MDPVATAKVRRVEFKDGSSIEVNTDIPEQLRPFHLNVLRTDTCGDVVTVALRHGMLPAIHIPMLHVDSIWYDVR